MSNLLQDFRYALRVLLKSPGYTAVAVLVLGLGIGANTAVFSVVNAVLLRPLPYPEPDRLVLLRGHTRTIPSASVSLPDYLDWRATQRSFTDLTIFRRDTFNLSFSPGSGVPPERVRGQQISANYFGVLGLRPALGRDVKPEEDTPGGPLAVLISDSLWRRRFASNPHVIGQRLSVDGEACEIIGVVPAALNQARVSEVYLPLGKLRKDPGVDRRDNHPGFNVLGRLRPGATLEAARAEMAVIAKDLERRYPDSNTGWSITLRPMLEAAVGTYRESLYLLLGAVGCVLLIACANVANLQLARAAGRTKELAVRAALGASRARIMRQVLAESLVLATAGGLVGMLFSLWAMDAIISLSPAAGPRFAETRLDWTALLFTAAVALGTGLLAGLWPAWRVSRAAAMATALHEGAARGSSGGASQHRALGVLVVAQVALAVVLLAGAGMAVRSFWRLQEVPLGFRCERLLTMLVSLPEAQYPRSNPNKGISFFRQTLERVCALPGVESAATVANMPFGGSDWETSFHITGTPEAEPGKRPQTMMNFVSAGYFHATGTKIIRGREFGPQDVRGQAKVLIIDEEFARQYFPGQDPIGKHIDDAQAEEKGAPPMTIVGVAQHIRANVPGENPDLDRLVQMYYCAAQDQPGAASLVVRVASGDPLRLAEPVRRVVQSIDPELPVSDVMTMEGAIGSAVAPQRLTLVLLATFATLALTLASIGLYGTMSLGVTQRTRELGIRLALGAQRGALLRMVMRQGTTLVCIGLAAGLLVALGLGRALTSILYEVSGSDPLTLGVVTLVLGLTALLACWIPALRATRVDPMVALRDE